MKNFSSLLLFGTLLLCSCGQEKAGNEIPVEIINADKEALAQAIADRDSLFVLVNEITGDMSQIKELEKILAINNSLETESSSQREQIKNDIEAIKLTLQQRREKLDQLEKKLKMSKLSNSKLEKTIATLSAQIDSQNVEIETLTTKLFHAKGEIVKLEQDNDSLSQTIQNVSSQKAQVEEIANQAISNINELNKCYYAIGSKKELKNKNILESGFLKKTKVLENEFDDKFFSTADRRTLNTINLHSKKAKILTNHPENSYLIEDHNGQKILKIKDRDAFWNLSNYLVIQID